MKKIMSLLVVFLTINFSFFIAGGTYDFINQPLQKIVLSLYIILALIAGFNIKDIGQVLYDAFSKRVDKEKALDYKKDIEILAGIEKSIIYFAFIAFMIMMISVIRNAHGDIFEFIYSIAISTIILFYAYLIKLLLFLPMENTLRVKALKVKDTIMETEE